MTDGRGGGVGRAGESAQGPSSTAVGVIGTPRAVFRCVFITARVGPDFRLGEPSLALGRHFRPRKPPWWVSPSAPPDTAAREKPSFEGWGPAPDRTSDKGLSEDQSENRHFLSEFLTPRRQDLPELTHEGRCGPPPVIHDEPCPEPLRVPDTVLGAGRGDKPDLASEVPREGRQVLAIRVRCGGQEGREDAAEALPTPPPSRSGGQGSFWGLTPTLRGDRAPSCPPQARSWGGCVDEALCVGRTQSWAQCQEQPWGRNRGLLESEIETPALRSKVPHGPQVRETNSSSRQAPYLASPQVLSEQGFPRRGGAAGEMPWGILGLC